MNCIMSTFILLWYLHFENVLLCNQLIKKKNASKWFNVMKTDRVKSETQNYVHIKHSEIFCWKICWRQQMLIAIFRLTKKKVAKSARHFDFRLVYFFYQNRIYDRHPLLIRMFSHFMRCWCLCKYLNFISIAFILFQEFLAKRTLYIYENLLKYVWPWINNIRHVCVSECTLQITL